MPWAILAPVLVVLFELLVFVMAITFVRYAVGEHDSEWPRTGETQTEATALGPVATPSSSPSHAA